MRDDIRITVASRLAAEHFDGLSVGPDGKSTHVKYAVISITSSDTSELELPTLLEPPELHSIIRLTFDDLDTPDTDVTLMSSWHAKEIWDFLDSLPDSVELILIHCAAGFSRSPGVAAAIEKALGRDDYYWFRTKAPNRLVYRLVLEEFENRNSDKECHRENSGL